MSATVIVATTTSRPLALILPPPPVTIPPRKFDEKEYRHYRHLSGMPKIPQVTMWHYMSVLVPIVLLLILFMYHKEQAAKDLADEISKTKRIRFLLLLGTMFAAIVVMVHLQIIPPRYVRILFPRWRQPPTMPKYLKIALVFCFLAFIVYPTIKFIRRMNISQRNPLVHRPVSDSSYSKKE